LRFPPDGGTGSDHAGELVPMNATACSDQRYSENGTCSETVVPDDVVAFRNIITVPLEVPRLSSTVVYEFLMA